VERVDEKKLMSDCIERIANEQNKKPLALSEAWVTALTELDLFIDRHK